MFLSGASSYNTPPQTCHAWVNKKIQGTHILSHTQACTHHLWTSTGSRQKKLPDPTATILHVLEHTANQGRATRKNDPGLLNFVQVPVKLTAI